MDKISLNIIRSFDMLWWFNFLLQTSMVLILPWEACAKPIFFKCNECTGKSLEIYMSKIYCHRKLDVHIVLEMWPYDKCFVGVLLVMLRCGCIQLVPILSGSFWE